MGALNKLKEHADSLFLQVIKETLEVEPLDDSIKEAARIDKCLTCPFLVNGKKCSDCKCYIRVKASMKSNHNPLNNFEIELTHCPQGKWPGDDMKIVNYYRKKHGKPMIYN